MSVLVVIMDVDGAEGLLRWGNRAATAQKVPLRVLCAERGLPTSPPAPILRDDVADAGWLIRGTFRALDAVGLPEVEVVHLRNANPPRAILAYVESTKISLLVAADDGSSAVRTNPTRTGERLIKLASPGVMLLDLDAKSGEAAKRIVVTAGDAYGRGALREAATLLDEDGVLVPLVVTPPFGERAEEHARTEVELAIREAGLEPSDRIQPEVVVSSQSTRTIARASRGADLLLLGGSSSRSIGRLRATPGWGRGGGAGTAVGVFRHARPGKVGSLSSRLERLFAWTPALQTTDRIDLFDRLLAGASLSADFLVLMCLSAAIATLGLLQDSTAVVIGAMVVAPLMTPLIAAGLSLVQGNNQLFRRSLTTMAYGVLAALSISVVITLIVPRDTLTLEVMARGTPTLLDLGVALVSGAAAAYALARPNVAQALAGVAIAAALVPPLASVGIALSSGAFKVAQGASVLLLTNLVAIVIGAAVVFWALGVQGAQLGEGPRRWVRRAMLGLGLLAALLVAPLWLATTQRARVGQIRPLAYPLAEQVSKALIERVDEEKRRDPRIAIMTAGRMGLAEGDLEVVILILVSKPAPQALLDDLDAIVRREMREDAETRIQVLQAAPVEGA